MATAQPSPGVKDRPQPPGVDRVPMEQLEEPEVAGLGRGHEARGQVREGWAVEGDCGGDRWTVCVLAVQAVPLPSSHFVPPQLDV